MPLNELDLTLANKCIICGEPYHEIEPSYCLFTGGKRCKKAECYKRASEYRNKRDGILREFAKEKELVLRPLTEKLNSELFLLESEYLKGKDG